MHLGLIMKVTIDYMDGQTTMHDRYGDIDINPLVWDAYRAHMLVHIAWQEHLGAIREAHDRAKRIAVLAQYALTAAKDGDSPEAELRLILSEVQ